ncbi:hypothetical protein BDW68DRAFT_185115 [Aspergillus falconensis]
MGHWTTIAPLSSSPLPYTFLASDPLILMNHSLPLKPPISIYFHVYTPACKPATMLCYTAVWYIDYSKPIPVNSIICPFSEDTIIRLEKVYEKTINSNNSDNSDDFEPPHLDELFSWIWNNSNNGGSCLDKTSSIISQLLGFSLSCETQLDNTNNGCNDKISPTKYLSDGKLQIPLSGYQDQPMSKTTICSPSGISQSKYYCRKRPIHTILGHTELAVGRGPQTRIRIRPHPYLDAELIYRKLQWEEIEKGFEYWLRNLMFVNHSVKCLRTREVRNYVA